MVFLSCRTEDVQGLSQPLRLKILHGVSCKTLQIQALAMVFTAALLVSKRNGSPSTLFECSHTALVHSLFS